MYLKYENYLFLFQYFKMLGIKKIQKKMEGTQDVFYCKDLSFGNMGELYRSSFT